MAARITSSPDVDGLLVIEPSVFRDARGEFLCTFNAVDYAFVDRAGRAIGFVEDDVSVSRRGVLRGLHGDDATWKLMQCVCGEVYFVVADVRRDSPTYLRWSGLALSETNRLQVLVPAGCVNGMLCVSDRCAVTYKQSRMYDGAARQITVRWDDPLLGIRWPIETPALSERDAAAPFLVR